MGFFGLLESIFIFIMKIQSCYSQAYDATSPTVSMRKLKPVAMAVQQAGVADLLDPGVIDTACLRALHAPEYVDAFLSGEGHLASSQGWPWQPKIRDGVLAIQAGQLLGAELALKNRIAANIAQGFHHALYEKGSSYCTFNGLALVAQQQPGLKIFVLDCDEHGGNGTSEFTERLPTLFNFSICGTYWDFVENERSILKCLRAVTDNFMPYRAALKSAFAYMAGWKPDLVIYQAGADPHINDPLGTLGMTTEQMTIRDRLVFEFCLKNKFPVLFVLAGGYQEPIVDKLVPLHLNTFKIAAACLSASESAVGKTAS